MEYYSAIKKEWNTAICSNMNGPKSIILSEVSQTQKDKYYISLFVESKKMIQMNLFTKQKQTNRLRERTYGYGAGGKGWWGEG